MEFEFLYAIISFFYYFLDCIKIKFIVIYIEFFKPVFLKNIKNDIQKNNFLENWLENLYNRMNF